MSEWHLSSDLPSATFDVDEECPHCDEPQPSQQMDAHVAAAHADLPPCRAYIETEDGVTYRCAHRVGHSKGKYGKWHASKLGSSFGSRYVWNDSHPGATPHRPPERPTLAQAALDGRDLPYRYDGTATYEQADEGHPEPPSEDELNDVLPVRPDPRQPAYDAVYDYIRRLGGYLPQDPAHRNAVIWRAVHAALGATPVGRCVSSHCVEGGHILPVESEAP